MVWVQQRFRMAHGGVLHSAGRPEQGEGQRVRSVYRGVPRLGCAAHALPPAPMAQRTGGADTGASRRLSYDAGRTRSGWPDHVQPTVVRLTPSMSPPSAFGWMKSVSGTAAWVEPVQSAGACASSR